MLSPTVDRRVRRTTRDVDEAERSRHQARLAQKRAATTKKAQLATVDSLTGVTARRLSGGRQNEEMPRYKFSVTFILGVKLWTNIFKITLQTFHRPNLYSPVVGRQLLVI